MLDIPESLTVVNSVYALDGGSRTIWLRDSAGGSHTLDLAQHGIPSNFSPKEPPGALVFDGVIVPVRGDEERRLLDALRAATYSSEPAPLPPGAVAASIQPTERRVAIGKDIAAELASVDRGPDAALRHAVAQVLSFVDSDRYVEVARRFGRLP